MAVHEGSISACHSLREASWGVACPLHKRYMPEVGLSGVALRANVAFLPRVLPQTHFNQPAQLARFDIQENGTSKLLCPVGAQRVYIEATKGGCALQPVASPLGCRYHLTCPRGHWPPPAIRAETLQGASQHLGLPREWCPWRPSAPRRRGRLLAHSPVVIRLMLPLPILWAWSFCRASLLPVVSKGFDSS